MNGRALFQFNPDLFKDEDDATPVVAKNNQKAAKEAEEEKVAEDDDQIQERKMEPNVDESLFQGEMVDEDVDFD